MWVDFDHFFDILLGRPCFESRVSCSVGMKLNGGMQAGFYALVREDCYML